eukprot:1790019-Rhodomonas_salina.1
MSQGGMLPVMIALIMKYVPREKLLLDHDESSCQSCDETAALHEACVDDNTVPATPCLQNVGIVCVPALESEPTQFLQVCEDNFFWDGSTCVECGQSPCYEVDNTQQRMLAVPGTCYGDTDYTCRKPGPQVTVQDQSQYRCNTQCHVGIGDLGRCLHFKDAGITCLAGTQATSAPNAPPSLASTQNVISSGN